MLHFVYLTTNLINGKQYIGDHSTDNLNDEYLGSGRPYLKNAIKKYGRQNFKREILEFFPSKQEAFDAQEKFINFYNTLSPKGYNISPKGGNNCFKGISEDGIKRIRNSKKGKKFSLDHKQKLSESHKGKIPSNKNRKQSEETKLKIKKANTGKKRTPEQLEKMRQSHLGKTLSEESKQKLSNSKKGTKASDEARKNLSNSHKGKIPWNKGKTGLNHKKETKEKIKQTMKEKGICPQLYK